MSNSSEPFAQLNADLAAHCAVTEAEARERIARAFPPQMMEDVAASFRAMGESMKRFNDAMNTPSSSNARLRKLFNVTPRRPWKQNKHRFAR